MNVTAAPAVSQAFDVDSWLSNLNIGAPSASSVTANGSQDQQYSGFASPGMSQDSKYLPPQRRSSPKDDVHPAGAQPNGDAVRLPPGFGW